jgi:hypothetical protein
MSILIKGMEMPEKCGSCDLFHVESPMHCTVVKGHKTVGAPYGMPRPDWCPLVEIPEPHGRLIDADRVTAESIKGTGKRLLAIDTAPTVIEAEGSENHDD